MGDLASFYVLIQESGVFTKTESFFKSQGGLKEPWGKNWEKIKARNLIDARQRAIKLRRQRFPNSHVTQDE